MVIFIVNINEINVVNEVLAARFLRRFSLTFTIVRADMYQPSD